MHAQETRMMRHHEAYSIVRLEGPPAPKRSFQQIPRHTFSEPGRTITGHHPVRCKRDTLDRGTWACKVEWSRLLDHPTGVSRAVWSRERPLEPDCAPKCLMGSRCEPERCRYCGIGPELWICNGLLDQGCWRGKNHVLIPISLDQTFPLKISHSYPGRY